MDFQVAVICPDRVFARMLQLEFEMMHLSVFCADCLPPSHSAEIVILDLDNPVFPSGQTFGTLIGFTRSMALPSEELKRQCSLILHRPFEMKRLREEVSNLLQRDSVRKEQTLRQERGFGFFPLFCFEKGILTVEGREVVLSPTEQKVMKLLWEKRGKVVSREEIACRIGESSANKADVYICCLRKKTEVPLGRRLIETVRGQGYRIPE